MTSRTRAQGWAQVDEALFAETGWFVIDNRNCAVPGVRPPSRPAGLALVGQGSVATVVGRLRTGVVVVDVDVEGARGHAVTETLARWCHAAGLWHLVRPSGGADGRAHLYVVVGDRLEDLKAVAADLRATWGLAKPLVDVRTQVRPLTAPHKAGGCPTPYGDAGEALRSLTTALRALERAQKGSAATDVAETPSPAFREPLVPQRRRKRTPLEPAWQRWLETGVRPPVQIRKDGDASRSTWEAMATQRMVRAGWSAQEAWDAIAGAHPDAMVRARGSYPRWVAWVWNAAVTADDTYTSGAHSLSPDVAGALAQARDALRALAWDVPAGRERTTLLLVGHTVLDRMARVDERRIPVPQRDLLQDTGIKHRATLSAALERLDGVVGRLHREVLDRRVGARASTSFEFEIPTQTGVTLNGPPSRHTPDPRAPLPVDLPPALPRSAWLLLRTLATAPSALTLEEVAHHSQASRTLTSEFTVRQRRSLTGSLSALARLELVACDAHGRWSVTSSPMRHDARFEAQHRRAEVALLVEQERQAYRASGGTEWNVARAASVKAQRAKEAAWWNALTPAEQQTRRAAMAARFDAASVVDQARLKDQLARRETTVGRDPDARRVAWLLGQSPEVRERRAQERAIEYTLLPHPVQAAKAMAWQGHRDRWHLGRGLPHDTSTASHITPARSPAAV